MRSSKAAASSAALPRREWPVTMMRCWSMSGIGHEIIDRPLQSPGPRGDGSAVVLRIEFSEVLLNAPLVGPVGIDVAVVERGDRVTAFDHVLDAPDIHPRAATGFGRPVVHHALAAFGHPVRRQTHRRVTHQRVVAKVVHAENDRRRTLPAVGNDQHQVNRRQLGRPERDGHFSQRGLAVRARRGLRARSCRRPSAAGEAGIRTYSAGTVG